jgi:aspartyl-tRNA(Asn)/glutamyl-tRNA(Gln) amidotransferase subunit B
MTGGFAAVLARYEPVIGLEVHCQLLTRSKLFCGCPNRFGAPSNTLVCEVCLGLPGSLPVLNRHAVTLAIRASLALGCRVHDTSVFERKNYFYPDLPKGYQISQYQAPLATHGSLEIAGADGPRSVRIARLHMEEDAGKLLHEGFAWSDEKSGVDLNRAGVPLVEIVTEPDLRSPEEAHAYLTALRAVLLYAGVSDGNMEEGSLRCDANISTRRAGETELGTKVEIKNLNSVRSLERALRYEEERQRGALERGEPLVQETRHFDEETGATHTLRSKEEAFDYRYFPEPDLTPLAPDRDWVEGLRDSVPMLPAELRSSYVSQRGLTSEQARLIAGSPGTVWFFDQVVSLGTDPRSAANWITQDLAGLLNTAKADLADAKVNPQHIADLVRLVADGTISATGAKQALEEAFETGDTVEAIVERRGLRQVVDSAALGTWVDEAIAENPGPVQQFRGGKDNALNAVLGQVMKKSGGSADPKAVRELLLQRLSGP